MNCLCELEPDILCLPLQVLRSCLQILDQAPSMLHSSRVGTIVW